MGIISTQHNLTNWRLWLSVAALLMFIGGCNPIPATPDPTTPSAPPAPGSSPFGMVACLGNRYPAPHQRDLAIQKMREAGVRWQREEFTWVEIEPQRGQFRWDAYDQAVNEQISAGINLVGLLDYGAAWWGDRGTDKDMSSLSDEKIEDWRRFVQSVVERYKDQIHYWEIWNEENIDRFWDPPNAADYVQLLQASHEVIANVAPGSQIVMGGTSGVDLNFIQQVYTLGGARYFDILAVHPYQPANPEGNNPASSEFVEKLTSLSAKFPDKPIWLTEVGWSTADAENWWWVKTGGGTAEQVQASYLVRMYVQALAMPQVEKIFWYDFRNDNTGNPHEDNYGLVQRDSVLQPKQSYLAYQTMTRLLEGAIFQRQMRGPTIDSGNGLGDDIYEYRFSRGKETISVLWKSRGGSAPRSVTVDDIQAAKATLIQLDGDSQPIDVINQQTTVELTEEPLYLVFNPSPSAIVTPPSSNTPASSATILLVDVSGSMDEPWRGGIKIESAKQAAFDVINMIEQESAIGETDHQIGIASFTTNAELNRSLTNDHDAARQTVDNLTPFDRTNIGAGIQVANEALTEAPTGAKKIIILLSDGLTNEGLPPAQILSGPVQEAAEADTCIYTVGFGEPGELDENLLRNIATNAACGEYHYASAPSKLEQVYIRLRHQSLGTVLEEFKGQVTQGETVEAGAVNVPRNQGEMYITLHWPGSDLDLIVTDPRGHEVKESNQGVSWAKHGNMIYLIIDNPRPGNWELNVFGAEVPEQKINYNAIVSVRERVEPPPVNIGRLLIGLGLVAIIAIGLTVLVTSGSSAPRSKAGLQVVRGQASRSFVPLRRSPLTIGRDPSCDLVLLDPQVSSHHAQIQQTAQGHVLTDLGSKNGTHVNGLQRQRALLKGGEQLRIGQTELTFTTQGTSTPTQRRQPMRGAYLIVLAGGQEFARYQVEPGTVLGRYEGCPVNLEADALISRRHAQLGYQEGCWYIVDLESSNQTFVNGEPAQSQWLKDGDIIRLGNTRMRFRSPA